MFTKRMTIHTRSHGLEILLAYPPQQRFQAIFFFPFAGVWTLLGLLYGHVIVTGILQELQRPSPQMNLFVGLLLLSLALGWLIVGGYGLYRSAILFLTQEKLMFSNEACILTAYPFGCVRTRRYTLAHMTNICLAPPHLARRRGTLSFTYHDHYTIFFGRQLADSEARILVKQVDEIHAWSCHAVEAIVFGHAPEAPEYPARIVYNPDVTDLTFPFVRLQRILLDSRQCSLYLAERFVTYAVNALGERYLRQHVDVQVYGAPEDLQPNLKNALTNLCRRVSYYPVQEMDTARVA